MKRWWWLSFAGADGFRGACLVQAPGFIEAVQLAHRLGINPGGEVQGTLAPENFRPNDDGWVNRLMDRAECERFDDAHGAS